MRGEKRGREVPGPFKKSPGTFRVSRSCPARTTGPSRSLGPVLSRPVPGPSRDFPGRDSPAGKPSGDHPEWETILESFFLLLFLISLARFICFTQKFSVVRCAEIFVSTLHIRNFCTPHYRKFLCRADETSFCHLGCMISCTMFSVCKARWARQNEK